MSELKPCPFCNGELRLVGEKADRTYDCTSCQTTFYIGFANPKSHINTRPTEDELRQRIAILEAVIKRALGDMDEIDEACRIAGTHLFTHMRQDLESAMKEQGS